MGIEKIPKIFERCAVLMVGKTMEAFLEELYHNPEMEILFQGKRYLISGFSEAGHAE